MAEHDGSGLRDLDELRTFVQIVDSGSMTAAGRVPVSYTHLTLPTIYSV